MLQTYSIRPLSLAASDTWEWIPAADWLVDGSGAILQRGTTILWAHTGQSRAAASKRKLPVIFTSDCIFCGYFVAKDGFLFFASVEMKDIFTPD